MSKVSLAEQIKAVEMCMDACGNKLLPPLAAALATLTMLQKYEPEVRDLLTLCIKRDEVLPGSRIEVRE
jgi:hypothetical protein